MCLLVIHRLSLEKYLFKFFTGPAFDAAPGYGLWAVSTQCPHYPWEMPAVMTDCILEGADGK